MHSVFRYAVQELVPGFSGALSLVGVLGLSGILSFAGCAVQGLVLGFSGILSSSGCTV